VLYEIPVNTGQILCRPSEDIFVPMEKGNQILLLFWLKVGTYHHLLSQNQLVKQNSFGITVWLDIHFLLICLGLLFHYFALLRIFESFDISLAWGSASLQILTVTLVTLNCHHSIAGRDFKAKVCLMNDSFELVEKTSAWDSVVQIVHLDHINRNIFSPGISDSAKRNGQGHFSNSVNDTAAKTIEGRVWGLQQVFIQTIL
jgi:hypothetical protein